METEHLNTWWGKSLATLAASMVFEQGMRITPFIRLWSVMRVDRLTLRSMILTLREVLTKRHCVLKAR